MICSIYDYHPMSELPLKKILQRISLQYSTEIVKKRLGENTYLHIIL